ncbi:MAG: PLP-dependent cysteine synthase family protein, partial [Acidimicrobiia bacterium]
MDVLVVVGDDPVPERIAARARRTLRVGPDADPAPLVADLRGHLPRVVGVPGTLAPASALAAGLHRAGLPVELVVDGADPADPRLAGIEVRPLTDSGEAMEAADSLLDLIGRTPLLRLDRTARDLECHLLAKLETFNPGGSSKDRPALAMVEAAERDGRLQPGGTIVEPTSGNTGVGLAIVAARKGYRCTFVCPNKVAPDKIALLRAYGAEVIVCPTAVDPGSPDSYYSVSDRLAREIPGGWKADQYHNPENPRSQEETTAPEIWEQTRGRITHFV